MEILNKSLLDALISHIEPITGYDITGEEPEALKRAFEITLCEYLFTQEVQMDFAGCSYVIKLKQFE